MPGPVGAAVGRKRMLTESPPKAELRCSPRPRSAALRPCYQCRRRYGYHHQKRSRMQPCHAIYQRCYQARARVATLRGATTCWAAETQAGEMRSR